MEFAPRTPADPINTVLPLPIYVHNPILYSRILVYLDTCCGLEHDERLVLAAVLQHMPVPESMIPTAPPPAPVSPPAPSIIDRILSLGTPLLKQLASLFTTVLLDVRAWGGRRSQPSDGSTTQSPGTASSTKVSGLYDGLLRSLNLVPIFPVNVTSDSAREPRHLDRQRRQIEECLIRQCYYCPITMKKLSLEHIYIIPQSIIIGKTTAAIHFWEFLHITIGTFLCNELFNNIGNSNLYSTHNSLALDATIKKYFEQGLLQLVPIGSSLCDFDAKTSRYYDVSFRWRSNIRELITCATRAQNHPEDQLDESDPEEIVHFYRGMLRAIEDGDKFRIFTNNPGNLPLPHPLVLAVHGMLWSMIQSAGLAESVGEREVEGIGDCIQVVRWVRRGFAQGVMRQARNEDWYTEITESADQ